MAQNQLGKDVFVILRLRQIMWMNLLKKVRNAGYRVSVELKNVDMKTNPVSPILVAFIEGPLHESIELFCEKA